MKRCKYCLSTENLTIDHKIPKSKGGTNDPKNLQTLCKACNTRKSSLTHGEVCSIWKWFLQVQDKRVSNGKTLYYLKGNRLKSKPKGK